MFTDIKKIIPTGKDIYIQANFIGSAFPPIKWKGIFIEEELNIHPALICLNPNSKPITKTKRDTINKNKVKRVEISFGKNLSNKSIETNPPHLYAEGAINPVIHNIKNLATSSGHGSALFNTYLKKTCTKITITIKSIAIHANCLPILKKKVFIFSRILKTNRRILIVKFTTKFILNI